MTLKRKISAKGYTLNDMIAAIEAASEAARTGGELTWGPEDRPCAVSRSDREMSELLASDRKKAASGGGYLGLGYRYQGLGIQPLPEGGEEAPSSEDIEHHRAKLEEQLGAVNKFVRTRVSDGLSSWEYTRRGDNRWVLTWEYSSKLERWEQKQPVLLYPGMERSVAARLGVEKSDLFWEVFHKAINILEHRRTT